MILIRSKPEYENCNCQSTKDDKAFSVNRLLDLAAGESANRQSSSELKGNGTRIGVDEVTGSDCASDVAGFGQVLPVLPSRGNGGVSTRSNGGEGNESSLGGDDLERPLSVYPLNVSQRNEDSENQIVQNQIAFGDFDAGSPKQQVGKVPNPSGSNNADKQTTEVTSKVDSNGEYQHHTEHYGEVFAESGSKFHSVKTLGGK